MNITTDGNHLIKHNLQGIRPGVQVVYLSGVSGGATMSLAYTDEVGTIVPLTDGTVLVGNQYSVDTGIDQQLVLTVASATGTTDINVTVKGRV